MANLDAPRGFSLAGTGAKPSAIMRERITDGGSVNSLMAPGDAYTINANGKVTRANAGNTVHGICVAVALATKDGPISYNYVPDNTELAIIGCEDSNAEFEVQVVNGISVSESDIGKYCDVVDAAPNTALGLSQQQVGSFSTNPAGNNFVITRLINRPDNEFGLLAKVAVRMINALG